MNPATRVEAMKLRGSLVGIIASVLVVLGVVCLCGTTLAAIAGGNTELAAKLGRHEAHDWTGLFDIAAQVTGAGGLVAFGVVLAWLFAREFTDGTITGLFALPVGRGTIAAAKLTTYLAWAVLVSVALGGALVVLGLVLGLGIPGADAWADLARQVILGVLSAVVASPVAWVATRARSILAGVATTVGIVVVAQVGVLAGAGPWLPFAAPALWAASHGTAASPAQVLTAVAVAVLVMAATVRQWARLQLDR